MLSKREIEYMFVRISLALRLPIVLDSIHKLPGRCGCRIGSHDVYGILPEVEIDCSDNNDQVFDRIALETARLAVIVRLRGELAEQIHDCQFIAQTSPGKVAVVEVRTGGRTVVAKGQNPYQAYQKIKNNMIELLPQMV